MPHSNSFLRNTAFSTDETTLHAEENLPPFRKTKLWPRLRSTPWAKQWGWNLFTMAMGTGAVMICTYNISYNFRGKIAIATIFLFIDIVIFLLCFFMQLTRAIKYPRVFAHSFFDQSEAPWVPTFNLAAATILIGMMDLGITRTGPWLITTCEVLFYVYLAFAALTAFTLQNTYRLLPRPLHLVSPVDALEVFPLMLTGTIGATLCQYLQQIRPDGALTVLLLAIIFQGMGLFIGILKFSVWMTHHITLPRAPPTLLPAYVITVGVPGFTAYALSTTGRAAQMIFPANQFLAGQGLDPQFVGDVFAVVGVWFGLLMTGFFIWIMFQYIGWALLNLLDMSRNGFRPYNPTWWSWTFPLTGMVAVWGQWGQYFPSRAFAYLSMIGTVFVACMWLFNMIGSLYMFYNGHLPGIPTELDYERDVRQKTGEQVAENMEPIRTREE